MMDEICRKPAERSGFLYACRNKFNVLTRPGSTFFSQGDLKHKKNLEKIQFYLIKTFDCDIFNMKRFTGIIFFNTIVKLLTKTY